MASSSKAYDGGRRASTYGLGWAALVVVLSCVACGRAADERPPEPGTAGPMDDLPVDPDAPYPPAVVSAIESLAEQLSVAPKTIELVSYEEVEWPDGCLGLPAPYEVCTAAIVPGWRVSLSVGGDLRTFRVDAVGTEIREE